MNLTMICILFLLCLFLYQFVSSAEPFVSDLEIDERCKDFTAKKLVQMYAGKSIQLLNDLDRFGISSELLLDAKNYPLIGTILLKNGVINSCI